ncbi:methyl-accepting chemotaxis protein [Magnetospirillum fulvum]|uniref:Methyl-accepting chemotaxis sensory transducer with Cache sensor n=1 Tax=Magnetospirillum fulvum TaxID=1082 RepID=A0A1H6GPF3_MAGFU|nr:cache domain-containing protein [Magnetospirillum fulvum]SEH25201.1 methyl-accepting chemotaxis sensory transducer with Cache sensor [Magnetospirillum fulvum]
MRIGDFSFQSKLFMIISLSGLTVAVLLGLSLGILNSAVLKERQFAVQSSVDVAHSVLVHYQGLETEGKLSHDDAVAAALDTIRGLRYGDGEYFFVSDVSGVMMMHPIKKELEGKNLNNIQDKTGRYFYRDFFQQSGKSGYVSYYWPKPGHDEAVEKLSYVKSFEPWKMVLISGVYMDDVKARFQDYAGLMILTGTVGIIVIVIAAILFRRHMVAPLNDITTAIDRLLAGNTEVTLAASDRRDEVGVLTTAVVRFSDTLRQMKALEASAAAEQEKAEASQRAILNRLATQIEDEIKGIAQAVATSAENMRTAANDLVTLSQSTTKQTDQIAQASDRATSSVQTVASAAEELAASIREIGSQAATSTRVASSAVDEANKTGEQIRSLADSVDQISQVINLITDIASQTNLLALNATIEAARAGEAGKGFAVVAGEVKTLANQTAQATDSIIAQVQSVQTATSGAVEAIRTITARINEINGISSAIAAAVEEQAAATREIAASVHHAANDTESVLAITRTVSDATGRVGDSASGMSGASETLAQQASLLDHKISDFRSRLMS